MKTSKMKIVFGMFAFIYTLANAHASSPLVENFLGNYSGRNSRGACNLVISHNLQQDPSLAARGNLMITMLDNGANKYLFDFEQQLQAQLANKANPIVLTSVRETFGGVDGTYEITLGQNGKPSMLRVSRHGMFGQDDFVCERMR